MQLNCVCRALIRSSTATCAVQPWWLALACTAHNNIDSAQGARSCDPMDKRCLTAGVNPSARLFAAVLVVLLHAAAGYGKCGVGSHSAFLGTHKGLWLALGAFQPLIEAPGPCPDVVQSAQPPLAKPPCAAPPPTPLLAAWMRRRSPSSLCSLSKAQPPKPPSQPSQMSRRTRRTAMAARCPPRECGWPCVARPALVLQAPG